MWWTIKCKIFLWVFKTAHWSLKRHILFLLTFKWHFDLNSGEKSKFKNVWKMIFYYLPLHWCEKELFTLAFERQTQKSFSGATRTITPGTDDWTICTTLHFCKRKESIWNFFFFILKLFKARACLKKKLRYMYKETCSSRFSANLNF